MRLRILIAIAALSATFGGAARTTLRFAHPDPNQAEVLSRCAADFAATGITVAIDPWGGPSYAETLAEAFIAGSAPDVLVTDPAQGPAWAALGYLLPVEADASSVAAPVHPPGLDGASSHGVPSAWGSVALAYRSEALTAAGITVADLEGATLDHGANGSFDTLLARLTLDAEGRDALNPDFDARQVVQHGFATGLAWGAAGVSEWGWLPMAAGVSFGAGSRVDDPRLVAALAWYLDLWRERGIALAPTGGHADRIAALLDGSVALLPVGSWDLAAFAEAPAEIGFARLPVGAAGRGGVVVTETVAVWAGTNHPEAAWAWVRYLTSPACQNLLGASGVLFPTATEAADSAVDARAAMGLDVRAFAAPTVGWASPIVGWPPGVDAIMGEAMDALALGLVEPAAILSRAQAAIDRLPSAP